MKGPVIACAAALVLGTSVPARAELVKLTNGRIIPVDDCRFNGDEVSLTLRGGARLITVKSMVQEVLPDEVPHAHATALEFLAAAVPTPLTPAEIRDLVGRLAGQIGVDTKLAHAVVQVESNYDPKAVSAKGAMGLMQLMPVIVKEYSLEDPYDPVRNLQAGLTHLRDLLKRFVPSIALAAYNAGEGTVERYGGIPPYRETQDYVRRVLALAGLR